MMQLKGGQQVTLTPGQTFYEGPGEIDVLVVSDGVLSLPGAMLGHNADPAVRAAWLEDLFLPPDVLEWALNVVVVRSSGRTILIDAGIGVDPGLEIGRAHV